jgi:hypothetical protein
MSARSCEANCVREVHVCSMPMRESRSAARHVSVKSLEGRVLLAGDAGL